MLHYFLKFCNMAISRSCSKLSLFQYLVLMAVIAEKDLSQRYVDPKGRSVLLAVLTNAWYPFFNLIYQLCKDFFVKIWLVNFHLRLMSISCSYRLIGRCYIFIFLTNGSKIHWNSLEDFFKHVGEFCFQVF